MLTVMSVSVCLCALAVVASVMVVRMAAERLRLDLMTTLLWFGLAEWPSEPRPPRARRLDADAGERQLHRRRRRSAHRSRGRRSVRRRPAAVPPAG